MSRKCNSLKNKTVLSRLLFAIILLGIIALGYYNIKTNTTFWITSASNCITIIIALVFSYWLVQRKNDLRKQKEILASLLFDLRTQFEAEDMYNLSERSPSSINMRNRDISNKIEILNEVKTEFNMESEVNFIVERFDEYKDFVGNHIDDPEYLKSSTLELKRPITLISTKLFKMAFKLYS